MLFRLPKPNSAASTLLLDGPAFEVNSSCVFLQIEILIESGMRKETVRGDD